MSWVRIAPEQFNYPGLEVELESACGPLLEVELESVCFEKKDHWAASVACLG